MYPATFDVNAATRPAYYCLRSALSANLWRGDRRLEPRQGITPSGSEGGSALLCLWTIRAT